MAEKDPFYVGYLPLPEAIKKFLVPLLVGNLVLAVGIAAVVASQRREPGDGVWDTEGITAISGWIIQDPYPRLRAGEETYLLVEQGKIGVQERLAGMSIDPSLAYEVSGYVIEREGRKIIEIDGALNSPIKPSQASGALQHLYHTEPPIDLGTHTLHGEIVDPKCYLGVMQPGDGKTHKVCATLCIKGGIPPMFLVKDAAGNTAAYLLTDAEGNAIPESVYPYIADPIELTGRVLRDGDLLVLRADLGSIRRLGSAE